MKTSKNERRALVGKANNPLSISRQCELLDLYRSGYYYRPATESELNLYLMELIDKKYLDKPFMGVPIMTQWLRKDKGIMIGKNDESSHPFPFSNDQLKLLIMNILAWSSNVGYT